MSNLLKQFYLLSKLTTSLVLFIIVIFLGYLFAKAYLDENNKSNVFSDLKNELYILSNSVEENSENLRVIGDAITNNNEFFKDITTIINDLKQKKSNKELIELINKINDENVILKKEISNLSLKIDSFNNQDSATVKRNNEDLSINNLIKLIKLKLESGIKIKDEIQLLQDFNYNEEKIAYLEKLIILSNKNFIGLNKLNEDFDKITPIYLKEYLLKKNKNIFVKYLSNVVSLQPNFKGDIQDETIKLFVEIKEKLVEKDIMGALNNLLLINDSKIYFNQWIKEAEYFVEFENTLNKLLY